MKVWFLISSERLAVFRSEAAPHLLVYGTLAVLQSLACLCSGGSGGGLRELWVRAAAAGGGAGAPGVRPARSHITRWHEAPRWGGTFFTCGGGITAPVSPWSGPQICAGVEETCPPPPALYPPELTVRRRLEREGGGRAEVSEGAATMLGSGKTPGSNSREERRTAEPGRRLGKKALEIPSVAARRRRHQTRRSYAAIWANPRSANIQDAFETAPDISNTARSDLASCLEVESRFTSSGGFGEAAAKL